MADFRFDDLGDGNFRISGAMEFETAPEINDLSKKYFEPHSIINIDFSGVDRSDSAGLALLLEWVNWAKFTAREIHYSELPRQIMAIAEISEVDSMLSAGSRWTGLR